MDVDFDDRYTAPEYSLSRVVFYPDRIYHAASLAASPRSARYRYNVQKVRNKLNIAALAGEVYLDGQLFGGFLRLEYHAARLAELAREQHRVLGDRVQAWMRVLWNGPSALGQDVGETASATVTAAPGGREAAQVAETHVMLHSNATCQAYYVEIWETLEPPSTSCHDFAVLDLMGWQRPITRVRELSRALQAGTAIQRIEVAFAEPDRTRPGGAPIPQVVWDNNLLASHEEPRSPDPSGPQNTISDLSHLLDFQRGWFLRADDVAPVRYRNALMDSDDPDRSDTNIIEMRWLLQRVFGGSVVFFHEVTIPPGATEGTHQHVGSEEVYYIVEGQGTAYMGAEDDPATYAFPTVTRPVFNVGTRRCKELPVRPGTVIFTKSSGIHGIRNTGTSPLKFVAFLYHTQ